MTLPTARLVLAWFVRAGGGELRPLFAAPKLKEHAHADHPRVTGVLVLADGTGSGHGVGALGAQREVCFNTHDGDKEI